MAMALMLASRRPRHFYDESERENVTERSVRLVEPQGVFALGGVYAAICRASLSRW